MINTKLYQSFKAFKKSFNRLKTKERTPLNDWVSSQIEVYKEPFSLNFYNLVVNILSYLDGEGGAISVQGRVFDNLTFYTSHHIGGEKAKLYSGIPDIDNVVMYLCDVYDADPRSECNREKNLG